MAISFVCAVAVVREISSARLTMTAGCAKHDATLVEPLMTKVFKLAIAVKFHALNIELAGYKSYVPPLMCLVAVQPAPRRPLSADEFSFLHGKQANCVARSSVLKSNDQSSPGKNEFVGSNGDGQAA